MARNKGGKKGSKKGKNVPTDRDHEMNDDGMPGTSAQHENAKGTGSKKAEKRRRKKQESGLGPKAGAVNKKQRKKPGCGEKKTTRDVLMSKSFEGDSENDLRFKAAVRVFESRTLDVKESMRLCSRAGTILKSILQDIEKEKTNSKAQDPSNANVASCSSAINKKRMKLVKVNSTRMRNARKRLNALISEINALVGSNCDVDPIKLSNGDTNDCSSDDDNGSIDGDMIPESPEGEVTEGVNDPELNNLLQKFNITSDRNTTEEPAAIKQEQ